jgi:hypothetical protein
MAIAMTPIVGSYASGIPILDIISSLPGQSKNFGMSLPTIKNKPTSPVRTRPVMN